MQNAYVMTEDNFQKAYVEERLRLQAEEARKLAKRDHADEMRNMKISARFVAQLERQARASNKPISNSQPALDPEKIFNTFLPIFGVAVVVVVVLALLFGAP